MAGEAVPGRVAGSPRGRDPRRSALALLAALLLAPAAAGARELTLEAEAAFLSRYIWRGVTLTNHVVFQPSAWIGTPLGAGSIEVGAWANVEPRGFDSPDRDIGETGGDGGLGEVQAWVECERELRIASLAAGVQAYVSPPGSFDSSAEVYASVTLDLPLQPRFEVDVDLVSVKGSYLEAGLSKSVSSGRLTLDLGLAAGFSAGQGSDPGPDGLPRSPSYNFHDDGLTHLEASVEAAVAMRSWGLRPSLRCFFARDELARYRTPRLTAPVKVLFGVAIQWSRKLGQE